MAQPDVKLTGQTAFQEARTASAPDPFSQQDRQQWLGPNASLGAMAEDDAPMASAVRLMRDRQWTQDLLPAIPGRDRAVARHVLTDEDEFRAGVSDHDPAHSCIPGQ